MTFSMRMIQGLMTMLTWMVSSSGERVKNSSYILPLSHSGSDTSEQGGFDDDEEVYDAFDVTSGGKYIVASSRP